MPRPATALTDDELRRELERTSPAWQEWVAAVADIRLQAPAGITTPEVTPGAARHREVQQEIWRRENDGGSANRDDATPV